MGKMIDFKNEFLPAKLDSAKEITALENRDVLAYTKKGNIRFSESRFAEYFTKILPCYWVNDSFFVYSQQKGVYEQRNQLALFRILAAYYDVVMPDLNHEVNFFDVWNKMKIFAPVKEDYTPNVQYIAFNNYTVDIINRKVKSHSAKHWATNYIPHDYIKNATCEIFDEALETIFNGDDELISVFWEMAGYMLYYGEDYPLQKIFIFLGAGSNGKSLVMDTLRYMLGKDNYASARLDEISSDFGASHFYGKMVNISPETELTAPANTALLKSITGGDSVSTTFKHKNSFSAQHFTKFVISTNQLFPMTDTSPGMFRRLQILPFNQTFVEPPLDESKRVEGILYSDKTLLSKIKPEISGIINKALDGLFRLMEQDWTLTHSSTCQTSLTTVVKAFNPFKAFIEDKIKISPKTKTFRKELIDAFYEYQEVVQLGQTYRKYTREEVGKNILQELQRMYPNAKVTCYKSSGDYVFDNVRLV